MSGVHSDFFHVTVAVHVLGALGRRSRCIADVSLKINSRVCDLLKSCAPISDKRPVPAVPTDA